MCMSRKQTCTEGHAEMLIHMLTKIRADMEKCTQLHDICYKIKDLQDDIADRLIKKG